jgi:hypothetical protein
METFGIYKNFVVPSETHSNVKVKSTKNKRNPFGFYPKKEETVWSKFFFVIYLCQNTKKNLKRNMTYIFQSIIYSHSFFKLADVTELWTFAFRAKNS